MDGSSLSCDLLLRKFIDAKDSEDNRGKPFYRDIEPAQFGKTMRAKRPANKMKGEKNRHTESAKQDERLH